MVSCLTALGYKPLPQHKFNNCYYLGFWLLCLQDIVNFFISAHLYMCMLSVLFLCQPIWDAVVDFHPQIFIWLGDNIYGDFKRPFKIFGQERTVGPWKNVPRFVPSSEQEMKAGYEKAKSNPGYARLQQNAKVLHSELFYLFLLSSRYSHSNFWVLKWRLCLSIFWPDLHIWYVNRLLVHGMIMIMD